MALPVDEKLRQLRDPAGAGGDGTASRSRTRARSRGIANWGGYALLETFSASGSRTRAAPSATSPRELGTTAWDVLCDIAIDDDLRTVIASQDRGQDDASWAAAGGGVARPSRRRSAPATPARTST